MMLMPEAPAPGRMKPVNGFENDGAKGGNCPWSVEEEHVAGPDLDGQRAAVEPALERLDLQRHAVVVDAVPAVDAGLRPSPAAQLNPMRGPKLFRSAWRLPWRNGCTIGLISS